MKSSGWLIAIIAALCLGFCGCEADTPTAPAAPDVEESADDFFSGEEPPKPENTDTGNAEEDEDDET